MCLKEKIEEVLVFYYNSYVKGLEQEYENLVAENARLRDQNTKLYNKNKDLLIILKKLRGF